MGEARTRVTKRRHLRVGVGSPAREQVFRMRSAAVTNKREWVLMWGLGKALGQKGCLSWRACHVSLFVLRAEGFTL